MKTNFGINKEKLIKMIFIDDFLEWWNGTLVEVQIVECRDNANYWSFHHTLVNCPDGTRKYVMGHLGKPGEKIRVNSWQLKSY